MKKLLIFSLTLIINIAAFADEPLWNTYGKTLPVKGGVGIVQFVEAIFDYKPDDWSREATYDRKNGFFHYYEEGAGHVEYYVSYWNRNDGKKLVIMSYDSSDFGNAIKPVSSPWGYISSFDLEDEGMPDVQGAITVDTGFRAYLYDEAKSQLVPLQSAPFNNMGTPVRKHYLLQLPQKGKDIRVREEEELGVMVYHTLKWNGMTFDFVHEGNPILSFFCTDADTNIRTAPNGKVAFTTPANGSYGVEIDQIVNGWCHLAFDSVYEYEEAEVTELHGSDSGYWVHHSVIGARGNGDGGITLRAAPDANAKIVFSTEEDTQFEPLELKGRWVKVRVKGTKTEGWLRSSDICSNPLTNCC